MAAQSLRDLPQSVPLASVRMTPAALNQLLDELDAQSETPATSRRQYERIGCRCTGLILVVEQSGFHSTLAVPVRNISQGGVCFLHRSMIHPGSPCQMQIRTPGDKWLRASGKVVRSRYLKKAVYEIGLQFDAEIKMTPFTQAATPKPRADAPKPAAGN